MMRCFARWEKDDKAEVFFRDQTILQFGNCWDFRANFILLNPGSALPLNDIDKTDLLREKSLSFFVEPQQGEKYVEFSIDRLMNDVLKLFLSEFGGGTIRLYNLFNLKNQKSGEAIEQFTSNCSHPKMFAAEKDIKFCEAPVIIASGGNARENEMLKNELIRYVSMAKIENLYALSKIGKKEFAILKAIPDTSGFVKSYHPSFTFKYKKKKKIGEVRI